MPIKKPEYRLARRLEGGVEEAPEIVPLLDFPEDMQLDRRGFFGVGVSASAALALLAGCKSLGGRSAESSLRAHKDAISSLKITPAGDAFYTASLDGALKKWSLPGGTLLKKMDVEISHVYSLAMDPGGGRMFAGNKNGSIECWDTQKDEKVEGFKAEAAGGIVLALGVSLDGTLLVSGISNGNLEIRSAADGELIRTLDKAHSDSVLDIVLTDEHFVSSSKDGSVKLWSLPGGEARETVVDSQYEVPALAVSSDGKQLLIGSARSTIQIRELLGAPDTRHEVGRHNGRVRALRVAPRGDLLASGGADKLVKLWWLPDETRLASLSKHLDPVGTLDISPDQAWLVSGSDDGVVILWNLHREEFHSYAFDPASTMSTVEATSFSHTDAVTGHTITYTLPCGSPIPAGSVCVCNCVPGTHRRYVPQRRVRSSRTYCSCNKVCTCVPVYR